LINVPTRRSNPVLGRPGPRLHATSS
jgi:hypothetical protein